MAFVASLAGKDRYTLAAIKKGMNSETLAVLEQDAVEEVQFVTAPSGF